MTEPTLPPLRDVMKRHDIIPKRALGQNFLLDANLTDKIARIAGDVSRCNVIEIGPGPGGLTRALLARGAPAVYAVEKDTRCIAALRELEHSLSHQPHPLPSPPPEGGGQPGLGASSALAAAGGGATLHIIEADALKIDLLQRVPAPRKIVANLPYNIATVLLLQWLEQIYTYGPQAFESLTLMFQKEVAERIAAAPNTKAYGRLSVMTQWLCAVKMELDIPPAAFTPPPKVTSTVITLTPRPKPAATAEMKMLERVLAAAFGQRRKMLRVALKSLSIDAEKLLEAAHIEATRRGETLDVAEFCRLAECYRLLHASQ